ncbi:hypothetical protein CR513_18669, partial [Mucuna pruriens]
MSAQLVPNLYQVDQSDPHKYEHISSSQPPSPTELKPLPSHLKYAYLDTKQQLLVIISNNLHREHEEKLLHVLRQHKKAIGWKLSDLPGINPFICMHRIIITPFLSPCKDQKFMQITELCRNVNSLSARYRVTFDELPTWSRQGLV